MRPIRVIKGPTRGNKEKQATPNAPQALRGVQEGLKQTISHGASFYAVSLRGIGRGTPGNRKIYKRPSKACNARIEDVPSDTSTYLVPFIALETSTRWLGLVAWVEETPLPLRLEIAHTPPEAALSKGVIENTSIYPHPIAHDLRIKPAAFSSVGRSFLTTGNTDVLTDVENNTGVFFAPLLIHFILPFLVLRKRSSLQH